MGCVCREENSDGTSSGWSSLEDCRPPCPNYEAMQASYAAQDMQPAIDKLLNQEPYIIGGDKPTLTLQRDSNYLFPHGSYIADWVDNEGKRVFDQMMLLSDSMVRQMIAERIAGIDPAHLSNLNVPKEEREALQSIQINPEFWMRPGNKEFVLIQNDGFRYCYGIYCHDFNNYLIRGETKRIAAHATKVSRGYSHGAVGDTINPRLLRALGGEF